MGAGHLGASCGLATGVVHDVGKVERGGGPSPCEPLGPDFSPQLCAQGEVDGALLPPEASLHTARSGLEAIRSALAARQFFLRGMLLGRNMFRKERIPIALTLLLAGEGGLTAGIEIDGVVSSESGKSHGSKVWNGLRPRYRPCVKVKAAGGRSSPSIIFEAEIRA